MLTEHEFLWLTFEIKSNIFAKKISEKPKFAQYLLLLGTPLYLTE